MSQVDRVVERVKARGVTVVRDAMPGRPWTDAYFRPNGVLLHHTASTSKTGKTYEASDIRVIKTVPWGPPVSQFYVGRTGTVYVITEGGANHAGTGAGLVKHGVPADQGNYKLYGIEVQSDGYGRDWTDKQWDAVHILTAELCRVMDVGPSRVWRHKDYDTDSGKVDTRYSLKSHREAVKDAMQSRKARRRSRLREAIRGLAERIARLRKIKRRKRRKLCNLREES